jgi:hypothetical protein
MTLPPDFQALHSTLSPLQVEFLEYVAQTPSCLARAQFAELEQADSLYANRLQSWPTFVGGAKLREMARVSTGLCALIKSLPARLFGLDPGRIAAFYGLGEPAAEEIVRALRHPGGAAGAVARGDFVDTPSGLRCLEFNIAGNLGGWQSTLWEERYLRVPLLARFLGSSGRRCASRNTLVLFLAHTLAAMQEREGRTAGPFHLALLVPYAFTAAAAMEAYLNQQARLLADRVAPGAGFRIFLCDYPELAAREGVPWLRNHRLHGIAEQYKNDFSPAVAECCARGGASFFNGLLRLVFDDKRNLALLSASPESGPFDDAERDLLRSSLPWTRQVAAEHSSFRGERVFLPDFLILARHDLVLKPAKELGGRDVHLGRATSPGDWARLVSQAIASGAWIVQEHVESQPYVYQTGAVGCAPHDVIWGLFVLGSSYGGAFLRMQPKDRGAIVNSSQGAIEGIVFEVAT